MIIAVLAALSAAPAALADSGGPATVFIFAGQSNEVSHGTLQTTYGFAGVPGGSGAAGVNAAASCYETADTLPGATAGSGTLFCAAPTSGRIYAGQAIAANGGPTGQVVSAGNNGGNFPAATGTGFNAGSYAVTPAAVLGSSDAPVAMTFAEADIGGSGVLNPHCQIWVPNVKKGSGSWQTYAPKVNSDFTGTGQASSFGPDGALCQQWTADNPGQTLYLIKIAIGGSSLCDLTTGNSYSPEYAGAQGKLSVNSYALLQSQAALAEAALGSQFGITSYAVKMIQWGQGEQDNESNKTACGFPAAPFTASTTPIPYLVNLQDLINRLAIPSPISASFSGSIAGTVLNVSAVSAGTVHQYQLLSGSGIAPQTYIGTQIDGVAGGAGDYNLGVYQATTTEVIAGSGGATCKLASITGLFFYAYPAAHTATKITKSCVSGGAFGVGDTLTGGGVLPGTTITALDSAGHTADGLYQINVNQSVASPDAPEAMTGSVAGFGAGVDSATFIMFRTFVPPWGVPSGVQIAQGYLNDNAVAAIPVKTVNTNDALKATSTDIHYHAAWISELGRRLYQAYLGACDYHSPTC